MIRVEIVKPTPQLIQPFIRLADDIYKDDPNWVAPSRREMTRLLTGKDNELFQQGIQRFFLAYDDDKPVARVLVGVDVHRNAQTGRHEGYFSLFESYDNMDYARAVLDAAKAFLKENGVTRLLGPQAPEYTLLTRGLLVEGFDGPPVLFNPYNPPYYEQMLTAYGFRKERDYLAYLMRLEDVDMERFAPLNERVQQRFGFKARNIDLNKEAIARVAQDMAMVIAEATPDEPGIYLPTTEDLVRLLRKVRPFYRKNLAVIAYAGARPVGVLLGVLDINRMFARRQGRSDPFHRALGLLAVPRIDTARCPMMYVVPEYQNKAVNAVLFYRALDGAKKLGIKYIEGSTMDENNLASINSTMLAGGEQYRTYRNFQLDLG